MIVEPLPDAKAADATVVVPADAVIDVVARALVRAGADASEAAVQAGQLVEADLRGHPSHGLRRLPVLVERIRRGLIVTGGEPDLVWSTPSVLNVDGRLGFGPVVAHRALDALLARVSNSGIAVGAIRRAHHLGMLAPYVERIAEAGCIGIALTTSEGLVHPWGGRGALIGTNPIGIAVPSTVGPVVLDMSTGIISAGKVLDYAARGRDLEEGWAVDSDGRPTVDATAASRGAISPFGGAKGFALGIALESLVGLATRTSFGQEVTGTLDSRSPVTKGDLFIAISLEALGASVENDYLAAYLHTVRSSGIDGASVSIPGDGARRRRARNLAEGVPVETGSWTAALGLAGDAPPSNSAKETT